MKLTATLMIFVCAASSGLALADHRHGRHGECAHSRQSESRYDKQESIHGFARHHQWVNNNRGSKGNNNARYARVLEVQPVYRYYKEPVNAHSCVRYEPAPREYTSYTGTVLGAVVGAALGHRIGDSHGDPTAAAVAGGLLGASVGRDIHHKARHNRGLRVEGPCRIREQEQTRRQLVEYKVTYRYNGEVHSARMNYDPGDWVELDVDVSPA